jgi:hypothetical protein
MAFHLVPYYACSHMSIPVTHLMEREELVCIHLDKDNKPAGNYSRTWMTIQMCPKPRIFSDSS